MTGNASTMWGVAVLVISGFVLLLPPASADKLEIVPKNFAQDLLCSADDLWAEGTGGCLWGKNCGSGCAPYQNYGTSDGGDDDLDKACLEHDKCLCRAQTAEEGDRCDRELERTATQIENDTDDCTGLNNFNPFCTSEPINCAAANVRNGMVIKRAWSYTPNCECKLHQDKQVCGQSAGGDYDNGDYDNGDYDNGDYDEEYEEEYEEDYEAPAPTPTPSPDKPSAAPGPLGSPALEKLNLELDWNPSSCYRDDSCSASKIVDAFTISEMTARLWDRGLDNDRCLKDSRGQPSFEVTSQVSKGTLAALQCMLENAAGANEDLWKDVYVNAGSCTGMPPDEYFGTVTRLYKSVGLNSVLADFRARGSTRETSESIIVDRDEFLDYVSERVGRKAWIECDPDQRLLKVVLVCVNPAPPYDIIDCTMDRNDPASTNGIPCRGDLSLPLNTKASGEVSDACAAYMLEPPADTTRAQVSTSGLAVAGTHLALAVTALFLL